ncbi:unnamed protein product [Effrenium voratum]|nr:unnamed protein product [Effrenium voratum]CAJ1416087.1 unnamed protein product [Effrenium voratum]
MGGKVSGVQACAASTCCMPDQAGSVIVKTPSKSTRPGFLKASDEAVSTPVEVLDEAGGWRAFSQDAFRFLLGGPSKPTKRGFPPKKNTKKQKTAKKTNPSMAGGT